MISKFQVMSRLMVTFTLGKRAWIKLRVNPMEVFNSRIREVKGLTRINLCDAIEVVQREWITH